MPRTVLKKKSEKTKKTPKYEVKNRAFEETIEILDSDDDFVIPNPTIRGRRSEVSEDKEKLRNKSAVVEDDFDFEGFEDLPDIEIDTSPKPPVEIQSIEVFESKTVSTGLRVFEVDGFEGCGDVEVDSVEYNYYDYTENGGGANLTHSKDAWKGLMQRMQSNQKPISTCSTSTSTFLKSGKGKGTKKPAVTFPKYPKGSNLKAGCSFLTNRSASFSNYSTVSSNYGNADWSIAPEKGSENAGSPPKKLKLEMDAEQIPSNSTSTSPEKTMEINKSIHPDAKIPAMFLKPEEKAALAIAKGLEKAKNQSNPNLILSVLSEPLTFTSVNETPDKFNGNIVKANEYSSDVDPYAGQKKKTCPFYKKLPGTRFSVDAFNYGLIEGIDWYFLSHFHSDHYIGLTKKFCKTIICSPPTANLVKMKLYVEDKCIRRLQLNKPYIIAGVEVILIDANHCPGSVMFIFRLPNGITYFHTGDFRFTTDMLDNHFLQGLKIDNLYLDTTYCDPKYDFPTQIDSIVELITAVKRKLQLRPKTLILCGSYLIGKERVYFSLAEALNLKVFANTDKRRVINALENPRFSAYLSDNEEAANIHVTQMTNIVPKFLSEYLATKSAQYTNIIGIKPSGWQFSFAGSGTSIRSHFNDTVTVIGVPYSEHSSFSELQQFVCATKPRKVQPTVNVGSESKRTAMMEHINKWMQS